MFNYIRDILSSYEEGNSETIDPTSAISLAITLFLAIYGTIVQFLLYIKIYLLLFFSVYLILAFVNARNKYSRKILVIWSLLAPGFIVTTFTIELVHIIFHGQEKIANSFYYILNLFKSKKSLKISSEEKESNSPYRLEAKCRGCDRPL